MTRSFGDKIGVQAGVIAEPGRKKNLVQKFLIFIIKKEILEIELTEEDKFIIVASDGVWEYLSN